MHKAEIRAKCCCGVRPGLRSLLPDASLANGLGQLTAPPRTSSVLICMMGIMKTTLSSIMRVMKHPAGWVHVKDSWYVGRAQIAAMATKELLQIHFEDENIVFFQLLSTLLIGLERSG